MVFKQLLKALLGQKGVAMDTEVFVRVKQDDGSFVNYEVTGVDGSEHGSYLVLDTKEV